MAEFQADKSHAPTPQRRQRAREAGQVAKSQDLGAATVLLAGALALRYFGTRWCGFLAEQCQQHLGGEAWLRADAELASQLWMQTIAALAWLLVPVLLVILAAAIIVHCLQVGLLLTPQRLMPDASRIDPVAGWGRIFSAAGLTRIALGLVKLGVIGFVAWSMLRAESPRLLQLAQLPPAEMLAAIAGLVSALLIKLAGILFLLALGDYALQWWRHERDLRMTTQELREEMREHQVDPQLAIRRRELARQQRPGRPAPNTPAVVREVAVIDRHGRVALVRDQGRDDVAPTLLAKGVGKQGEQLAQLARQRGTLVVEHAALADALFRRVGVRLPLPSDLVATLRGLRPGSPAGATG